jgi:type IV pilus modification protein PilV
MNRRPRGFTLIEALIGLALLSVGLFGAGAMLLGSLQAHGDALRQRAALSLVCDLADRIRANARAGAGYDLRTASPVASNCDLAAPCDVAQLAAADLASFLEAVRTGFPGPDTSALVEFEPAAGTAAADRYAISLRWRGPRDAEPRVVAARVLAPPAAG